MTINSIANTDTPADANAFPKLMISHNGMIVMFHRSKVGTVVGYDRDFKKVKVQYAVATYGIAWDMEVFTDYEGTVTLRNP